MFVRKKNIVNDTMLDKKIKNLHSDRHDAWCRIKEAVELVIVRNGVIELYPEGVDKEKAKKDAESAKQHLISAVAVYDDLCNQYKQAFEELYERVTTKDWNLIIKPSHEIIEEIYKNSLKKF